MKKKIVALLIGYMLLMSACNQSSQLLDQKYDTNKYLPQYDMQLEYAKSSGEICKNGDVYYAVLGSWIFYYDDVMKTSGKLCGRAECTHEDITCNAYIGDAPGGIQIYDNHIYWIMSSTLYRADLAGNNREMVQSIDVLNGGSARFVIHRGYLYTGVREIAVNGAVPINTLLIRQYVLGNQEKEASILFSKDYVGVQWYEWRFYRNQLYLLVDSNVDDDINTYSREMYEYDIKTNEWNLLWEKDNGHYYVMNIIVDENGIDVLDTKSTDTVMRQSRFTFKRKQMDVLEEKALDEGYWGLGMVEEYTMMLPGANKDENSKYRIFNLEGNLVREGEVEGKWLYCLGWDKTGILFDQFYWNEDGTMYYKIVRIATDPNIPEEVIMEYVRENPIK